MFGNMQHEAHKKKKKKKKEGLTCDLKETRSVTILF